MGLMAQELAIHTQDGVRLLGPMALCLEPGERVGLIGESGSGKSLLGRALVGLLPKDLGVQAKAFSCFGRSLGQEPLWNWSGCAWVPQDPALALHPLLSVDEHLVLLPKAWFHEPAKQARARMLPLIERLRLPTDRRFLRKFPHQMSGGQRQRLAIALALSGEPAFLVLDEPTTSLDPATRRAVVELLEELHRNRGLGYLWISHDLELMAAVTDRLMVLYGGALLEAGPTARILGHPRTPYAARLLSASCGEPSGDPGFLPAPALRPIGCPFQPRCPASHVSCGQWGPWQGTPGDGFRCENPLNELALQV